MCLYSSFYGGILYPILLTLVVLEGQMRLFFFSFLIYSDLCGKAKANMKKEAANENMTHMLITFSKTLLLLSLLFGRGCLCKRQAFIWPKTCLLAAHRELLSLCNQCLTKWLLPWLSVPFLQHWGGVGASAQILVRTGVKAWGSCATHLHLCAGHVGVGAVLACAVFLSC